MWSKINKATARFAQGLQKPRHGSDSETFSIPGNSSFSRRMWALRGVRRDECVGIWDHRTINDLS